MGAKPLLLLDEPTSAQDLGQQHAVLSMLKSLSRDKGFMVISILHDLNLVSRYSDKVWLLHQGKLFDAGKPSKVLMPEQIESVWGYKPEQLTNTRGETVLF